MIWLFWLATDNDCTPSCCWVCRALRRVEAWLRSASTSEPTPVVSESDRADVKVDCWSMVEPAAPRADEAAFTDASAALTVVRSVARAVVVVGVAPPALPLTTMAAGAAFYLAALAVAARIEEAQLAEQVLRLGRRTALERVGHWLLDVQSRLAAAGLGEGDRFAMPLTQETLGDVLGLSLVHINRIVQQLRRERLVDVRGGYATILEPERLRMLTEFSPMSTSLTLVAEV